MGAVADRLDGRFGGSDEPHDLGILELRVIADEPQDGIRPVLAPRHRSVTRTLLGFGFRQPHLGVGELEALLEVALGSLDVLATQLAGLHGVETLDALGCVAVGDCLDLERVQLAEIGNLVE